MDRRPPERTLAPEMMFALKSPCNNCPFRRDVAFYLRPGRVEEILASLWRHESFQCHKTTHFDEDTGEVVYHGDEAHCAGAMILLMKCGNPNLEMRIGIMTGLLDPATLNMDAPVYDQPFEMVEAFRERERPEQERSAGP